MKKPSAVLHMTGYGLVYGFLLAMLYIWGFLILFDGMPVTGWENIGFTAYFSFIFGALPGGVMGFIEGWILKYLTRKIQVPVNHHNWASTRKLALGIIGGLTFAAMFGLLSLLFGGWTSFVFTFIPATIAGGAAAYAVNRYMGKLRAWGNIGKLKNEYKPKNQLADTDSANDDMPMMSESDSQVNKLRF